MTQYAVNDEGGQLLAVWDTGFGRRATVIAQVPPQSGDAGRQLAAALDDLSEVCWHTYTHPASVAGDPEAEGGEAWRRAGERDAFPDALAAVRKPNLPAGGIVSHSYIRVEEAGHRVGRIVHTVGDAALADAIEAEVRAELDTVVRAELGDLSGRAAQAVVLSRADVSPTQVQAAWDLLAADPLGAADALLTTLDPTAAAVAASVWLRGAAELAAQSSGVAWTDVVVEADNIRALPHETPTAVLEELDLGLEPRHVILQLVHDALDVADGLIPDADALLNEVEDAEEQAARMSGRGVGVADLLPQRLTPLDPHRPAPDLLEDLLAGIDGCFLLWREHTSLGDDAAEDIKIDDTLEGDEYDDAVIAAEAAEEARWEERRRKLEELFAVDLRQVMATVDRHAL